MCVLGGVFVDAVIVQPLTEYVWLGPGSPYRNRLQNLARLFRALSDGLLILDKFYHDLEIHAPAFSRLFPCFLAYPDGEKTIKFQYLLKLAEEDPTRAVFKAQIESDNRLIVVKFVECYNADAHRLLATAGYAPELLYASTDDGEPTYGGLHMIVMDFLPGKTAHDEYSGDRLPPVVMDDIKKAIETHHKEGLVFGDLRTPNIMVTEGRAKLVDFDWCGVNGAGKYPIDLNMDIRWHEGVKRGGVMRKEHDEYMLSHL
jgi:serine/threonine protein kinase